MVDDRTIVVIGDWFIDENWVVSRHISISSTHTGETHYLSKYREMPGRITNLCGASETLEVLRSYFTNHGGPTLIGYGAWNRADDEILKCTLCGEKNKVPKLLTPFTIRSVTSSTKPRKERECIYDQNKGTCNYYPELRNLADKNYRLPTMRIIRRYEENADGTPHLIDRTDWQLNILSEHLNYALFAELRSRNVEAVVIIDHGKGVVNKEMIKSLLNVLKKPEEVKWYVRTKLDDPPWLETLHDNGIRMRLQVIDDKLATRKKGQRPRLIGNELAHASLELLGELSGQPTWEHGIRKTPAWKDRAQRVAILFDDNTSIAIEGDRCFSLPRPPGAKQIINIGRTTTFFNALIAQDISEDSSEELSENRFGSECEKALRCAYAWSESSSKAWDKKGTHFYGDYGMALESLKEARASVGPTTMKEVSINERSYKQLWEEWKDSSADFGIVRRKDSPLGVFQPWRGEGALEGYITVGSPKRDAINDLLTKIHQFRVEKESKHPFNTLLIGSPGWGKSHLARCMAKHFRMPHLEFSLSQMASSRDLIDCFDTVCSVQNREQDKILIFLDEVNARIAGHSALELLLSPIWDGTFIRDGKTYRLLPGVWVFASTEPIHKLVRSKKGSDFVSRLNGPVIELDSLAIKGNNAAPSMLAELKVKLVSEPDMNPYSNGNYKKFARLRGAFRTEQVYIGVSLLNHFWGSINRIDDDVLHLFHDLLPINGFRSMEFFVSKFEPVQQGEVYWSNVPSVDKNSELRRHIVLPVWWNDTREKRLKESMRQLSARLVSIEGTTM